MIKEDCSSSSSSLDSDDRPSPNNLIKVNHAHGDIRCVSTGNMQIIIQYQNQTSEDPPEPSTVKAEDETAISPKGGESTRSSTKVEIKVAPSMGRHEAANHWLEQACPEYKGFIRLIVTLIALILTCGIILLVSNYIHYQKKHNKLHDDTDDTDHDHIDHNHNNHPYF